MPDSPAVKPRPGTLTARVAALEAPAELVEANRNSERGREQVATVRWLVDVDRATRGYHIRKETDSWPDYWSMLPASVRDELAGAKRAA